MLNIGRYHVQLQTKSIIEKSIQLKGCPSILKRNYCNIINKNIFNYNNSIIHPNSKH